MVGTFEFYLGLKAQERFNAAAVAARTASASPMRTFCELLCRPRIMSSWNAYRLRSSSRLSREGSKSSGAVRRICTERSPTIPPSSPRGPSSRTPCDTVAAPRARFESCCGSEYEWAQHLRMARKAGVREAQIAVLAAWRSSPEFDATERAALQLAESVTSGRVSDEAYREAMRHFDHHDYVELTVTVGFYAMVARVLDAMAVELEPDFREYSPKLP